ncbi:hypothetical protein QEH59_04635 [Coraliomargarita sp. SDUM461004]|uniref:Uncharacterized protein n=1 Tax=Thalassobacterium sedimentorum TaxID=3041258 RepID=A0ABU1AFX2_9BACT|nr:hypothetical protein [Coraliomargarita sp. SDUM461004]MDQ8193696.1 hypothetical protein [Coraliomargarita sp. SDUM461004]
MIYRYLCHLYRLLSFCSLFTALISLSGETEEMEPRRLVYYENFAPYRNVEKQIRIAQAFGSWSVANDRNGRYLHTVVDPTKGFERALLVWDLMPIRFQELSILIKALEPTDRTINMSLALEDVKGRSFVVEFRPVGKAADGWVLYVASLREDTKRIYDRGKEISPFVHGRGEAKTSFEGFDFDNVAFKAIFMHANGLSQQSIEIGFRDLKLFAEL